MSARSMESADIDEIFETFKETRDKSPKIDVIIEHYLSVVGQLKKDLKNLKDDFVHHRKDQGQYKDSLEDFIRIQELSDIIPQNLPSTQICKALNANTARIVPFIKSEIFIWKKEEITAVSPRTSRDLRLIIKCAFDEGIVGWLWEQKTPVVVPISDFMIYDQLRRKKGNVILIPMTFKGEGIGIYILLVDKEKSDFTLRDLELLNILAGQAAVAIKYEELHSTIKMQEQLIKNMQERSMSLLRKATIGETAAGIAHEINNPLQIIMGNVQMARMGHKVDESLEIIEKQSFRIANIVRGLLNMARQNNESSSEILEVSPLISNTIKLIRGQIEKRNIELKLDLKETLPVIQCGSLYFQQILLNFILHAKQQVGQNGQIEIRSYAEDEDWIFIEMRDSGSSLPDEYIEKTLDPFTNLENGSELNLGLTVSVQMIKDIGGAVRFDSSKNKGNVITVKIPTYKFHKKNHSAQEVMGS